MQFLFPAFLWALAALAIPIIIHLFYFRRFRKVYFTNVRFLREVKEETSARSRLRNLLVLAMRLLALAFLVFAFAQPFLPRETTVKTGRRAVSIFVDNSFSMQALSRDVPLVDKAKQRAREIVEAYGPETRFQILTNDFSGRRQRLVSQDEAFAAIDEINIGPAVRPLSQVTARQKQVLDKADEEIHTAYLVSDFQQNITDLTSWTDTTTDLTLIPLQSVRESNVAIDSVWFDAPVALLGQNNRMMVRVTNLSTEAAENVRLSLRYNEQSKPEGTLQIPAGGSVIDTVNLAIQKPGKQTATLNITDYPIQFDDTYFFAFDVDEKIRVLGINGGGDSRYLDAALNGLPVFMADILSAQSLNYSQIPEYQLIILNDLPVISSGLAFELQQYVRQGGNLLVFPAAGADVNSYSSFLTNFSAGSLGTYEVQERQVGNINTEEFVFRDVFENRNANLRLPLTQANFALRDGGGRRESLMRYRDGSNYLTKYRVDDGNLYLSAAPLDPDVNNLASSGEIFIPMLYKMAVSASRRRPLAYTIGEDELIVTKHRSGSTDLVYKMRGAGEEFIPEQRVVGNDVFLGVGDQIRDAGAYDLFLNEEDDVDRFAFNFSRQESDLKYYRPDDLRTRLGDRVGIISVENDASISTSIEAQNRGVVLWKWCLILALLFLLAEGLLLRFWPA